MLPKYAVNHRATVWFLLLALTVCGYLTYRQLGRLEDPNFTLKTALVITLYPGANAKEVEENVTDVVETGIYRLKNVEKLRSYSKPGMSVVYVDLFQSTPTDKLDESWNQLRNKLKEIQTKLPPETLPPIVKDDFSQVYGIVLALCTEEGISEGERLDVAKRFQREFSLLEEVGRCELWGEPTEAIEVNISRAKLQDLNIPPALILATLLAQNASLSAGDMTVQGDQIRLTPNGRFQTVDEIGELELVNSMTSSTFNALLSGLSSSDAPALVQALAGKESQMVGDLSLASSVTPIKLRDVATIRRVRSDPPSEICRFNGRNAVAIAVAPRDGGNVIRMGEQVRQRSEELVAELPLGYELGTVAYQPDNVSQSVNLFMKNLKEAICIVAVVVMLALGYKSGLIITFSLVVTILATMCFMKPMGIVLERVSLAAFIIALGILVDNAVVIGDLILVRMQRGMPRKEACIDGAQRTAKQLLGATIVGALAFLPVYLIPINVGEYCKSLFLVVAVSLMLSWIIAMMQTPVFYYQFIKLKEQKNPKDPCGSIVHRIYKGALILTLRHRLLALLAVAGLCVWTFFAFQKVDKSFFPRAQRSQFMVDYWLDEGSSIHQVEDDVVALEKWIREQDNVVSTASFIGGGPPRFYLMYEPQFPNSAYGQIVVNVKSVDDVEKVMPVVEQNIKDAFPQARIRVQKFAMGQPTTHEVEARFNGPDRNVLRDLARQAEEIMRRSMLAKDVDVNWRQKVLVLEPQYSQTRGRSAGLSRANVNFSLLCSTRGLPAGIYSENQKNIPILLRGALEERDDLEHSGAIPVWGLTANSIPLADLALENRFVWEDAEVFRYNRSPSVIIGADSNHCEWTKTLEEVRPLIEQIPLPPGYTLSWDGQEHESQLATTQVLSWLPLTCLVMFAILIFLFNDFRQPLIVAATIPLTLIGVVVGMTVLHKVFGFMALLGVMGLLGMQIRNGVVLMDQIDEEIANTATNGKSKFDAVVEASLERMRPVVVAATTVIVGMIPLLHDPLFDAMATAMAAGLIFATALTLFVVPALYTIVFGISSKKARPAKAK